MRPSLTLIFYISLLCFASSCASQIPRVEDSNYYMAQVQQTQGYPCPECGLSIPEDKISANIRTKNRCPYCRGIFFGKPETVAKKEKTANYQNGYEPYGPNVFVQGFYSNIKRENNVEGSIKNSWDVSEGGKKGSMSSTTTVIGSYTIQGEYGKTTGAAGFGRYGGYTH